LTSQNNRGQIRIVEAMLTCLILIVGLSFSIYLANVYSATERGTVEETGTNIMSVLEDFDVVERIVTDQGSWEPELKELLANLLPPETFYRLTLRSALTNETIGEITNLPGQHNPSDFNFVTTERVVTISLPLSRNETIPLDVMLIMDVSGSMNDKLPGDEKTKLEGAQEAAAVFIDQLNSSRDTLGLVSFHDHAHFEANLTDDFDAVKAEVNSLTAGGYTNIGDGISYATTVFEANGRNGETIWVMILLSDGKANRPRYQDKENLTYAREYALGKATAAYISGADQGLRIYTIGLGAKDDIDEPLLKQIAEGPLPGITWELEGKYYYAPSSEDLEDIYLTIARDLRFSVQYDVIVLVLTLMEPR